MKALNKDAQNLRTIYSKNDVDRIENEIPGGSTLNFRKLK